MCEDRDEGEEEARRKIERNQGVTTSLLVPSPSLLLLLLLRPSHPAADSFFFPIYLYLFVRDVNFSLERRDEGRETARAKGESR